MALAAVSPITAMDSGVQSWVIHWINKGAPSTSACICGEITQCEPPSFTQVQQYLPSSATEGRAVCVPCEEGGAHSKTVAPVEFPVARRAEPTPQASAAPAAAPFDMGTLANVLSRAVADAVAPLQQRLSELEQRNAAMSQPVVGAMGMGMDPMMGKLLETLLARTLAPPPPNPFQEKLMEMAFANMTKPQEKDEMGAMVSYIAKLRLSKELSREVRDLGRDEDDQPEDKDADGKDDISVMGALKMAADMISNRGQPQQQNQPQAQQLAGPSANIFDDPASLQAQIMADPNKAAEAMRTLGRQYPDVAAIARKAMREGEKEAGGQP